MRSISFEQVAAEIKIPFDYDNATEEERRAMQKWIWEHPEYDNLDEEERWDEEHYDGFRPSENQEELRKQLMKAAHNTMEEIRAKEIVKPKKNPITINLDSGAVAYFKALAEETGISYQNLINMYLVQCAREKKRIVFA